jgi:hypothetical protein
MILKILGFIGLALFLVFTFYMFILEISDEHNIKTLSATFASLGGFAFCFYFPPEFESMLCDLGCLVAAILFGILLYYIQVYIYTILNSILQVDKL